MLRLRLGSGSDQKFEAIKVVPLCGADWPRWEVFFERCEIHVGVGRRTSEPPLSRSRQPLSPGKNAARRSDRFMMPLSETDGSAGARSADRIALERQLPCSRRRSRVALGRVVLTTREHVIAP